MTLSYCINRAQEITAWIKHLFSSEAQRSATHNVPHLPLSLCVSQKKHCPIAVLGLKRHQGRLGKPLFTALLRSIGRTQHLPCTLTARANVLPYSSLGAQANFPDIWSTLSGHFPVSVQKGEKSNLLCNSSLFVSSHACQSLGKTPTFKCARSHWTNTRDEGPPAREIWWDLFYARS